MPKAIKIAKTAAICAAVVAGTFIALNSPTQSRKAAAATLSVAAGIDAWTHGPGTSPTCRFVVVGVSLACAALCLWR